MKLIIKDKSFQVNWVSLTITKSSGPIIRIRANYINEPENALIKESILNETECSLSVGQKLSFVITNLEMQKRSHPETNINDFGHEISGVCLSNDLLNWFDKVRDFNTDVVVFQRGLKDLWDDFINRILSRQFKSIYKHDDADKICKDIFDIHSCFWRFKNFTNLQCLNQIVHYFSYVTRNVYGWTAFNAEEPITIITPNIQPGLKLNIKDWQIVSAPLTNNSIGDESFNSTPIYLQKIFKWNNSNNNDHKLSIFEKLCKRKKESFGIEDEDQFPKMPGCFKLDNKTYFIRSINYEFWADVDGIAVIIECLKYIDIEKSPPLSSSICIPGIFVSWFDNEYIRFVPPPEKPSWAFKGYNSPGRNSLYAKILTPTYVRKDEQGLYWTYKKDDELICLIQLGHHPYILGAEQVLNEKLECDGIALNAKTLVLSVSESSKEIKDSVHIKLNDELINTHSKQVLIEGDESIETHSKRVFIDGDTKINGKLEVSPK